MDTKVAEFAQKLGARIVQLRKEHNFAQERLATLARMNKGYLSSVESGQRVPSVGMLARLSKVLQVPLFDLFVFPDGGPMERLVEDLRTASTPVVEQLRAQYGVGTAGPKGAPRGGARSARTAKAATAKRKTTGRAPVKGPRGKGASPSRTGRTGRTSSRTQTARPVAPTRGAKRRR